MYQREYNRNQRSILCFEFNIVVENGKLFLLKREGTFLCMILLVTFLDLPLCDKEYLIYWVLWNFG